MYCIDQLVQRDWATFAKKMKFAGIKNIIFDLGGVLLNIDYHRTANAFKDLGFEHFDAMYSQFKADQLFEKLEMGQVSETDFLTILQRVAGRPVTAIELIEAWCRMLLDFRTESVDFLPVLATKYRIYLLSNTNSIHMTAFQNIYGQQFGKGFLDGHFTKAYYSHQIGMRKPNEDIYNFVLKDAGLQPVETLFIEDTGINLPPARALGMRTHLLLPEERIEKILL